MSLENVAPWGPRSNAPGAGDAAAIGPAVRTGPKSGPCGTRLQPRPSRALEGSSSRGQSSLLGLHTL